MTRTCNTPKVKPEAPNWMPPVLTLAANYCAGLCVLVSFTYT